MNSYDPDAVLDLWFPDDSHTEGPEAFREWIQTRMYGGMDEIICRDFADLTRAAAMGELDHWAETARGRLALLLALDQFPRSLWRDTPAAYAQDIKATRLAIEGVGNCHFHSLDPWEQIFFIIAISHCEGPDHLARFDLIDEMADVVVAGLPEQLSHLGDMFKAQNARVRGVIERFGRHPHRNPVYGRVSTPDEETYIATGDFPHVRTPETA